MPEPEEWWQGGLWLHHADWRVPASAPLLLAVLTSLPLRQSWACGPHPQPCLTLGVGDLGRRDTCCLRETSDCCFNQSSGQTISHIPQEVAEVPSGLEEERGLAPLLGQFMPQSLSQGALLKSVGKMQNIFSVIIIAKTGYLVHRAPGWPPEAGATLRVKWASPLTYNAFLHLSLCDFGQIT